MTDIQKGEGVIIEEGCTIGEGCTLGDYAIIRAGTVLGNNVEVQEYSIVGKQPRAGHRSLHEIKKSPGTTVGDDTFIGAHALVYAGTTIGKKCFLADGVHVREKCTIADEVVLGRNVTLEWGVSIDFHSRIVNNSQVTEGTKIGKYVFVGPDVSFLSDRKMTRDENIHNPPTLHDRCRIGGNATIMAGVQIGTEAAVGAGAVVHRDVADRVIVLGNPAKVAGKVPERDLLPEENINN